MGSGGALARTLQFNTRIIKPAYSVFQLNFVRMFTAIQAVVATVRSSTSFGANANTASTACSGNPYLGSTCTPCANLGTGTALSGSTNTTCGPNGTPCCNSPVFYIQMNTLNTPQFPYFKFTVGVRRS